MAAKAKEPARRVESISFFMTKNFLFQILGLVNLLTKINAFILLQNYRIYL
jgi:hypothetical protein